MARVSIPKLHSVNFKNGGSLRVVPKKSSKEAINRDFYEYIQTMSDIFEGGEEMAGFAIVVVGMEGTKSCGYAVRSDAGFGISMIPALFHDILLRRTIVEDMD